MACRALGLTCLWQGDFADAQANLMQAMRMYDSQRDPEAKFRFGMDSGACATAYLAHTSWQFGEVERARELIDEAVARAVETAHAPTLAQIYQFKALLEIFRGDATAARQAAETVVRLGRDHGLGQRFRGSGGLGKLVGPSVDDGMAIDVVDAGHDALLEFVL